MGAEVQSPPDGELARESQAGSLEAFEQLVYRYEGRLYAFVMSLCRNHADARELTQESFVRAYQAIDHFNPRRSFAAWLFTIARRKCIDRRRAAPPLSDDPMPDLPDARDPAELLALQEEQESVWRRARAVLTETQYQALWLRYAEDFEVPQIAEVLRLSRTHVKVLLFRARRRLLRDFKGRAQWANGLPAAGPRPVAAIAGNPLLVTSEKGPL